MILKIISSLAALLFVQAAYADPNYFIKLWEAPEYKGQHLFIPDAKPTLDPWSFSRKASSAEVLRGYVALYSEGHFKGQVWVLSSKGGPGRDGKYPNLNSFGADRVSSVQHFKELPSHLPYFAWEPETKDLSAKAGQKAEDFGKFILGTHPKKGGDYWIFQNKHPNVPLVFVMTKISRAEGKIVSSKVIPIEVSPNSKKYYKKYEDRDGRRYTITYEKKLLRYYQD